MARNFSSGGAGIAVRILLAASLMMSFAAFAVATPPSAAAVDSAADLTGSELTASAIGVSREQSPGPVTIGETVDCTVTVTIEAHRSLLDPRIRDDFSNRAMHYVPGSAEIVDIYRPSGAGQAVFTNPTGDPVVVYNDDEGLRLRWPLQDFSNTTDEDYVFVLRYQLQVTGVGPNGFRFWFRPWANQGFDCVSSFLWSPASSPATNRSVNSSATWTDVDQPLLTLEKRAHILGGQVPVGAVVPFEYVITNVGWSNAYEISITDDTFGDYQPDRVEFGTLVHEDYGDITDAITSWTQSGDEFSLEFPDDLELAPGKSMTLQFTLPLADTVAAGAEIANEADVDWSSMPDTAGARRYDDAAWEDGTEEWFQDTSTAWLTVTNGPFVAVDKHVKTGSKYTLPTDGGETTFEITLTNTGNSGVGALGLTDVYDPDMLEFVSASVEPDDDTDDGQLDWSDVTDGEGLAAGESMSISVTFAAGSVPGRAVNGAYVWDPDALQGTSLGEVVASWVRTEPTWPFGGEDSAEVVIFDRDDITFTKDATPGTDKVLLPGDTVTYHLTGENNTGYFLPTPIVWDTLPASVDYVPGTLRAVVPGYGEMPFTDAMLDGDTLDDYGWYDPATRTVFFMSPWGAPEGMFADMYFDVRVRGLEYSAAGVLNTAHLVIEPAELVPEVEDASSQPQALSPVPEPTPAMDLLPMLGTATRSASIYHFVDPITITKTATDVNGGKLVPGDEILWTITIQNIGLGPTTNVVVSDTVPAQTTYVAGSITGTGASDTAAPALRWNVGVLGVGQSATMTFRSRVNAGVPSGTTISNQATVDSDQSAVRASDFPSTTVRGDATLLQTGGQELVMIVIGLLVALGGVLLVQRGRTLLARA